MLTKDSPLHVQQQLSEKPSSVPRSWDGLWMGSGHGTDLEWIWDHRTVQSLRLEKSFKITESNPTIDRVYPGPSAVPFPPADQRSLPAWCCL